jgi:recombinational DNA repair protein (RecF pathway)
MHRGRTLDVVVSAEILHAPWARLVEPERYAVASVVAEMIDAFCEPDLALPDVYGLLVGAIAAVASSTNPQALLPRFELRMLEMLGLAPPLETCVQCGSSLGDGPAWLDGAAGGLLDAGCRERWRDLPELDAHDLRSLRALGAPKESAGAAALRATPRAAAAVEDLVAHHLGRRPKSLAALGVFGA